MMTLKYFSIDFDLILSYLITILCSLFVGKQIFLYLRRHFYEPYFLSYVYFDLFNVKKKDLKMLNPD